MKKFICFLSFCVLLGTISAFAAIDKNPIMRVGLYYEEDAVAVAKLQNIKGSGYRLGFFDSKRNFISLLSTGLTKIAVAKDANLSHKNAIFYESGAPAGSKSLGAFHVESSAKYANAGAAEAAVKSFQKLGYYAFPAYIQNTWRVRIG
ncbi:MAG: hypothetical protein RSC43_09170, partial [Clostridia bacterium]